MCKHDKVTCPLLWENVSLEIDTLRGYWTKNTALRSVLRMILSMGGVVDYLRNGGMGISILQPPVRSPDSPLRQFLLLLVAYGLGWVLLLG